MGLRGFRARLLLVEDDELLRELLEEILESVVARVLVADSGVSALKALADVARLDLLVSDVMMPGMDGLELACLCRRRDPSLKVVFISGSDPTIRTDENTAWLSKPLCFDDVVGAVQGMLRGPANL